jgi:ABC-type transport system involved in multi-copper enzyme maturation permease subunit
MIGPVLHLELLTGSRRGKLDLLRRAYTLWLMLQFFVLAGSEFSTALVAGRGDALGQFVNDYIAILVRQHFFLMLLVTPTFVAGAIADEKSRSTLQDLLTAQLSSWEIVVGKLLGRLAQVGYVALAALPLLALVAAFGEIPPLMVAAVAVVSIAPLFALGALSILSSVWATQTRDAVLRVYLWLLLALTLGLVADAFLPGMIGGPYLGSGARPWVDGFQAWFHALNPIHVLEAGWHKANHDEFLRRLLLNAGGWGGIGVVAVLLSVWRLRPAYEKQLGAGGQTRGARAALRRRPVDENPLAWKEREVGGIAPLVLLRRVPRWAGVLLTAILAAAMTVFWPTQDPATGIITQGLGVVLLASVATGIRASATICNERERQTWDTLLLTPLSVSVLIRDKQRGILQATRPYLWLGYALPTLPIALIHGPSNLVAVLLVVVACWVAMYFLAAAGLWCSVRSVSSWRSLLATFAVAYSSGFALGFALSGVWMMFTCLCMLLFMAYSGNPSSPSSLFQILLPYTLLATFAGFHAYVFWHVAESMLESAIRYAKENDRHEWFSRYVPQNEQKPPGDDWRGREA